MRVHAELKHVMALTKPVLWNEKTPRSFLKLKHVATLTKPHTEEAADELTVGDEGCICVKDVRGDRVVLLYSTTRIPPSKKHPLASLCVLQSIKKREDFGSVTTHNLYSGRYHWGRS